MTKLLATLLVCAALSCNGQLPALIWPTTVKCLTSPSEALLTTVRSVIEQDGLAAVFSDATTAALEDLGRKYGPEAVVCVLSNLAAAYTSQKSMHVLPERVAAAGRAQHFLDSQEVKVETP